MRLFFRRDILALCDDVVQAKIFAMRESIRSRMKRSVTATARITIVSATKGDVSSNSNENGYKSKHNRRDKLILAG